MEERAYAEVNLSKLRQNIRDIKARLSPDTKFMAIVKADGYGHGAVEVSRAVLEEGVAYLGVAWIGEARQLRSAGITAPILLLSEPARETASEIVTLNVTQTVYTDSFVEALALAAEIAGKTVCVHVKVDTGMGRIGVQPENACALIRKIKTFPGLKLEGVFTHFACADDPDDPYTWVQFSRFKRVLKSIAEENIPVALTHAANSAATINFPETHLNLVRVGLAMYQDVLTFKSRVAFVKEVPANFSISYGATYKTGVPTRVATLSVGYADGYSRRLSGKGMVIIGRKKYPVIGRVCMDMTVVDVGRDPIAMGEEVILIGQKDGQKIAVKQIAEDTDTIEYEVLCGIGKRVPRVYVR